MKKTEILGIKVSKVTMEEAVTISLNNFIQEDRLHMVITPNTEIIMKASEDEEHKKIINEADLVIPDGIGVVYASKLTKEKLKTRVGGLDYTLAMMDKLKDREGRVYILGAKPGVAKKAAEILEKDYPGINVVGARDGYYKASEEEKIIEEIASLNVDYLILGLGSPRQEKIMDKYKETINVKIAIGNGGAIDTIAGIASRAPLLWQKIGMEWLYRAITDPKRIPRLIAIPKFIIKVIVAKIKGDM